MTEHRKRKGLIKVLQTVRINASGSYDVIIGKDLLQSVGKICGGIFPTGKIMIVTDDKVAPLYLNKAKKSFEEAGFEVFDFVFKNGEESKNINTLSALLEAMAENRITRGDTVAALGGGVTGDMAGFAASIYLRGIRFVQIPTTLLAAVDSSVGGKTAIDLKAGKNLAGSFYQPAVVVCDTDTLGTLDDKVFAQGMAEVIKYGVIFDKELFSLTASGKVKNDIDFIIKRCVELKRDVVEKDEHDIGERQLLNFGHTVGHAIEKCSGFSVAHGEAVAIGMVVAARAAYSLGWSKEDCTEDIIASLKNNFLPTKCDFSADELFKVALNDKKRSGSSINLVVPERMGKCVLRKTMANDVLEFIKRGV